MSRMHRVKDQVCFERFHLQRGDEEVANWGGALIAYRPSGRETLIERAPLTSKS